MTMAREPAAARASHDPHLWLEDVEGERSLAWARAESERTLAAFEADRRYQVFFDSALEALQARDRIPFVTIRPHGLYNFWQDEDHVRGIIRRTSLESYRSPSPDWETVLDIDSLAAAENRSLVYQGLTCLGPEARRCLVQLSEGGRDSSMLREFDLVDKSFVEGGFDLPEARQSASWVDKNTLIVARDWGEGSLTSSAYPFVLKRLRRGQSVEQAEELFRGTRDDVGIFPLVLRDSEGVVHGFGAIRYLTTFESEVTIVRPEGPVKLPLPRRSNLVGIVDGRLVARLQEPWSHPSGAVFATDSVISFDLREWGEDPVAARPDLVWAPEDRQTLLGAATTKGRLLLSILDNVRGRALALDFGQGGWEIRPIALPRNASIGIAAASDEDDSAMFTVTDYLTPTSLYLYDGETAAVDRLKSTPARFDSSTHQVEQLEAVSKDGTRIPYFLVRPRKMALDGSTPTLLYGYGGFQNSLVPSYSPTLGRLWLEQGNAYVVANLRGGGEFGPSWHQSAQRENKQRTWDDYLAVAEDLISRRITSPRRLGAIGGSQGGLLVGTAITQRPDLFNAAIVQVPLFDMLRYHLIGTGSSWIGEYGDPENPVEREWLLGYSPYQRLRPGVTYPAPFLHSSTADDRVTPVHARKAAARLAELGQPYFYYENMEGGHSAAANLPETARRLAMEYVYASQRLAD